ncbi:MAG: hypothetical protein K2G31_00050 [Clostridia bacterium]|nr:hypothetical protein [Clostridia bacterium]
MDKLFVANIEDKEVLNKFYTDTEVVRDTPPCSAKDGDIDKSGFKQ